MTCPVCKGSGEVALMLRCGAEYQKRVMTCPECEGTGERRVFFDHGGGFVDADPPTDEVSRKVER